jgi:hypothetical protein
MSLTGGVSTHDILIRQGYRLVDDAWENNGRKRMPTMMMLPAPRLLI